MTQRILFISHEASRTGATNLLLQIQSWIRRNTEIRFETLLMRGGESVDRFAELGPVHLAFQRSGWVRRLGNRLDRWTMPFGRSGLISNVGWSQFSRRFDLVYSNTAVNAQAIAALRPVAKRIVCHVHELPLAISRLVPSGLGQMLERTDSFIAVSSAVAAGLESLGVNPARISKVPGFVDDQFLQPMESDARESLRIELGLPHDAWLVGVCGTAALHKGFDLLPYLAASLPNTIAGRPVRLLHIGGMFPPFFKDEVVRDIGRLGLANKLLLLGPRHDVRRVLGSLDAHLLPSREDSFPLVVLEAAALGVPTVCFADAGGAPEFCEGGHGIVVPYLDTGAMARSCTWLLENRTEAVSIAKLARDRVMQHYVAGAVMPKLIGTAGLA